MKKILGLTIAVVLIIGLVAGGTFAYFSDTEKSEGNTFTAGIIDIELSHLDGVEGAFINIPDIKPCQIFYGFFDIHGAEGTNPGPVYLHITGVDTGQGTQSDAEIEAEGEYPVHNIDDFMTISLHVVTERPPSAAELTAEWLAANTAKIIIHHDDHMKLSDLESAIIPVGFIEGWSSRIWLVMDLHLQAETDNRYQGDTCSFTVEVIMTQEGAPPPLESGNKIILENKDAQWNPILGDGIWGIVQYNVSSLTLDLYCEGLPANQQCQVTLNGPEVADWFPGVTQELYEKMASALGANAYVSPPQSPTGYGVNYVRGYWTTGPNLTDTWAVGAEGIYNIAQGAGHASNFGGYAAAPVSNASGELDANITTSGLPSGEYIYVKVIIKEDGGSYTTYLMEKSFGLFFIIP